MGLQDLVSAGVYGDPGYGVLQSSAAPDASVFTNQDFGGTYGSPGYGVLSDSAGPSLADLGSLTNFPTTDMSGSGGGGFLKTILGGLGSTLGALGPGLAAAGQIAAQALQPRYLQRYHPGLPGFAHPPSLGSYGEQPVPNLGGAAAASPDPMAAYAALVRSVR